MNEPVNFPPDDARDPLLDALQERLGDYGAPPPPGAWAGIRRRLPAPVLPWWRRPRRLLPLLALLLLVTFTGKYWLSRPGMPAEETITRAQKTNQPTVGSARQPLAPAGASGELTHAGASSLSSKRPALATTAPNPAIGTGVAPPKLPALAKAPRRATSALAGALHRPARTKAPRRTTSAVAGALHRPARARQQVANQPVPSDFSLPSTTTASVATAHPKASHIASPWPARLMAAAAVGAGQRPHRRKLVPGLAHSRRAVFELDSESHARRLAAEPSVLAFGADRTRARHRLARASRHLQPGPSHLLTHRAQQGKQRLATVKRASLVPRFPWQPATVAFSPASAYASQSLRRPGLMPLAVVAVPATLTALPDSSPPARPVRHWALVATAGPTLSYRTIGVAPAALGTRPDFAHLERPTVGLGAQVQVRRVLSGRWALAVGLGYQEYATSLALQQVDSARATHLSLRDTYRLLTLPVQLSYALGAPRGRLAKALLLGAEVGWYRGGRSTEGSDCGCQQQTYTASDSLYAAHSLALSLGLDLRYRIGGPASRWQWLVQPTGRYVLTPFVKPNTAGFSQRQPFSAGLFTGFSWDIR